MLNSTSFLRPFLLILNILSLLTINNVPAIRKIVIKSNFLKITVCCLLSCIRWRKIKEAKPTIR